MTLSTALPPAAPRPAGVPLETAEAREALTRARVGEAIAYGRIVGLYHDRLYNAAFRLVGRHDDAADVTQTAFSQGLDRAVAFPGDAEPYAWLFRLALDAAVARLRRRGTIEFDAEPTADPSHAAVAAALLDLDVEYRSLLVMADVERFAATRISAVTQAPLAQVRRRLFDARLALRERLSARLERDAKPVPAAPPVAREDLSAYLDGDLDPEARDRVGRCLVDRPAYGSIVAELLEAKRLIRELPRVAAKSANGRLEAGAAVDPTLVRLERKSLLDDGLGDRSRWPSAATIGAGAAALLVAGLGVAAAMLLPDRSGDSVMHALAATGVQVEPEPAKLDVPAEDSFAALAQEFYGNAEPEAAPELPVPEPSPGVTLTLDTLDPDVARRGVADVLLASGVSMGFDRDADTADLVITADSVPLAAWPALLDRLNEQGVFDGTLRFDRHTIGGVSFGLPPAAGAARITVRAIALPETIGPATRPAVLDPFDPFGDWGM